MRTWHSNARADYLPDNGNTDMASKGRKEKGIISISEEPLEREVIPGKVTETQWLELLETEEAPVVAGQLVDHLVDLAFSIWQEHYLEEEVFPHTVKDAKNSLLQIIEWQFLTRDEGEQNPASDPTWLEDDEPPPSLIDSWARGIAPISTLEDVDPQKDEDSSGSHTEMKWLQSGSEVTTTVTQPGDYSRRHTLASTVGASSILTDRHSNTGSVKRTRRKAEPTHIRPKARHPQARLEALSHPVPPTLTEEKEMEQEEEGGKEPPSPPQSYTPTSSVPSSPPSTKPLPYNMKPAQLRWQKDVTYDSSGNIVDMIKLDPKNFPKHRVRPKVRVSQPPTHPPPHTLTKQVKFHSSTLHTSPLHSSTLHSSPPTLWGGAEMGQSSALRQKTKGRSRKTGKEVGRGIRGRGGLVYIGQESSTAYVMEEGRQGTRESYRFPDVLTLPSLVDTIDPNVGVTVREGGRSVQGPKSPRKERNFLLPRSAMLPVHPAPSTTVLSGEVG